MGPVSYMIVKARIFLMPGTQIPKSGPCGVSGQLSQIFPTASSSSSSWLVLLSSGQLSQASPTPSPSPSSYWPGLVTKGQLSDPLQEGEGVIDWDKYKKELMEDLKGAVRKFIEKSTGESLTDKEWDEAKEGVEVFSVEDAEGLHIGVNIFRDLIGGYTIEDE